MSAATVCRLLITFCVICAVVSPSSAQRCWPPEIEGCTSVCQKCEDRDGNCAEPAACFDGCRCMPGFWRDNTGRCVPESQCPGIPPPSPAQRCWPPEIAVECRDACQKCEDRFGNCTQAAVCIPGCNCMPGFWRDHTGRCIPEAQCPWVPPSSAPLCWPPEIAVECRDACQKCEDRYGNCGQAAVCIPGCNCMPGFWRDHTGRCVPEAQCPSLPPGSDQRCYPPEVEVECRSDCQNCWDRYNNCKEGAICTRGCNCMPGFWRDHTGRCIPEAQCPWYYQTLG